MPTANPAVLYLFCVTRSGITYRFDLAIDHDRYQREVVEYGLTLPPGWSLRIITYQHMQEGEGDSMFKAWLELPSYEHDPLQELRLLASGYGARTRYDALERVWESHPNACVIVALPGKQAFKAYTDLVYEGVLERVDEDTSTLFASMVQYRFTQGGYEYAVWLMTNIHTSAKGTTENDRKKDIQTTA